MSDDSVAVTIQAGLAILDKSTGVAKTYLSSGAELFLDSIVAASGEFLIVGKSVHAIDSQGTVKWSVPLGVGRPVGVERLICSSTYSTRRQLLIAMCNDGFMYGVSTRDSGSLLWKQDAYTQGTTALYPAPSVGDVPLIQFAGGTQPGAWGVDPDTGNKLGVVIPHEDWFAALSRTGFPANSASTSAAALLDECGRARWRAQKDEGMHVGLIVGVPDDRIFGQHAGPGSSPQLVMTSLVDGRRLAGPTGGGVPVAAGADGTFFAITCTKSGTDMVAPDLVAYAGDLSESWRLTLPLPASPGGFYPCPSYGVALDKDGVMYMTYSADDGGYMLAIQTRSPGVAPSSWPLRYRSHNGSMWLD